MFTARLTLGILSLLLLLLLFLSFLLLLSLLPLSLLLVVISIVKDLDGCSQLIVPVGVVLRTVVG